MKYSAGVRIAMATPIATMVGNTIEDIVKTPAAEIITRDKAAADANFSSCLFKNPGFFAILDVLDSGCCDSRIFMPVLQCDILEKRAFLYTRVRSKVRLHLMKT